VRASRPLRRALAALLTLSAAASLAAAGWNAREAGTLALYEAVVPDEMTPAALALHIETLLAEQVDADWLGAEIDAALDADAPRLGPPRRADRALRGPRRRPARRDRGAAGAG
jgi:hypothetical protein